MASPSPDDEDEKPLDPAVERVRRRLSRLMLIAGLTLGLGIFAVFAAILYKIVAAPNRAASPAPPPMSADAALRTIAGEVPAGARLVSTALDGDRMAFTYETDAGTLVLVVDLRAGAVVNRLHIGR
jgi:hypothetical protein